MLKRVLTAALGMALVAPAALAQPGNAANPIPVQMRRGTDSITFRGVLTQKTACCSYVFKTAGGQKLYWSVNGPAVRVTIGYPDGSVDGPGLPNPLPLPTTGVYVFSVSPDLMAEGAFGRFVLKFTIPPLKAK